ncbi:CUE domain-containing protein 2 isoform X2 [Pleurodeles waltl]|uniref:CUE domain-containing protein 2 isoform X2 n=1 Tax=Pleurodeles waltl TaxID=8319 RepID=UPI003709BFC0
MESEKIIRDSLFGFIQSHIVEADLSSMDEVFFSYITSVLEELGSPESCEENFDMETFVEMMEAYVPGFADISSVEVCEMMFTLSGKLSEARNKENVNPKHPEVVCRLSSHEGTSEEHFDTLKRLHSEEKEPRQQEQDELKLGVDLLVEMFPSCSLSQAKKVLSIAKGDMEEAVQLIVEGKLDVCTNETYNAPKKEELKDFILQKYMMVDNDEDEKTHRPLAPKEAPKKMIRYIENQVVSTKGERYKDVKKPESEEMKKTYVNLKPAKKYRFH